MNDWDDYRFILALARYKTLRGAAKALHINHSTVSRKLAVLNSNKDKEVFLRGQDGYYVSKSGQALLKAAERMELLSLSAQRKFKAEEDKELSGEVSLSLSIPIAEYLLNDALAQFSKAYPNIRLSITATENSLDLDRSEADIVIRTAKQPPAHLVGKRLFPYAVSFYASKSYLEKTKKQDFVWIGAADDTRNAIGIDKQRPEWLQNSPYPNIPIHTRGSGYQMRYAALCAGMGLSRAACFMADQNPQLVKLPNSKTILSLDFWVLTHPDFKESPLIKTVMNYFIWALEKNRTLIMGQKSVNANT